METERPAQKDLAPDGRSDPASESARSERELTADLELAPGRRRWSRPKRYGRNE